MFYSAFLLGLVGSLHCVGMCGPLTLLLPKNSNNFKFFFGRLTYNFGRLATYFLLGIAIGFFGEKVSIFTSQKWISVSLGVLIIVGLLFYKKYNTTSRFIKINSALNHKIASVLKRSQGNRFFISQFSFGLVNGLLPCGMVYAALGGAFLQFQIWEGGIFMLLFGLGTLPLMFAASIGLGWLKNRLSFNSQKIITFTYSLVAVWLIVRGINDFYHSFNEPINNENVTHCEVPAK